MKTTIQSILILISITNVAFTQIVNIPDANFKAYLVGNSSINTNADSEIQVSEASAYSGNIICPALSIADLTGIEAFPLIQIINCQGNSLTSLNLSQNTALVSLYCGNNNISTINVTQNTSLVNLSCGNNNLSNLDISNNVNLNSLTCTQNSLMSLNLSNNINLTTIECGYNNLTSLDVSNNVNLTMLRCNYNNLTAIDVTNNTSLVQFQCDNNSINSLDVSQNTSLSIFHCFFNSLTDLNMHNLSTTTLTNFIASANPNLKCIEVDDPVAATAAWTSIDPGVGYSTFCSATTTIFENKSAFNHLTLYPNPSSNYISIKGIEKQIKYEIIDVLGAIVSEGLTSSSTKIDVSHLKKGVYFIRVDDEDLLRFLKD